jgi:hypothetical protein
MWDHFRRITKSKKDLEYRASGRAPAQQVQGPEFKPQYCQKRKERKCSGEGELTRKRHKELSRW